MARLLFSTLILATLLVSSTCASHQGASPRKSPSPAPPPKLPSPAPTPGDCSTIAYDMMDCLSYIVPRANETTPDVDCCTAFKTVYAAGCTCTVILGGEKLGIDLNMTRVKALPSYCKVSAPASFADCKTSPSPSPNPGGGSSPAKPPTLAPPTKAPSPPPASPSPSANVPPASQPTAPGTSSPGKGYAPAPAPSKAGAYSVAIPLMALITLLVVSLSIILV